MLTKKAVLLVLLPLVAAMDATAISIVTASLPTGTEMEPYNATLQATDGTLPYTWSVTEGYTEGTQANSFTATGTVWQSGMDRTFAMSIPFAFPFYGTMYTNCYVDIHGNINFSLQGTDWSPSESELASRTMIAVMWNDFLTYGSPVDIYVESAPNSVTIRWYRSGAVNASATLLHDGSIELRYGSGNANGGMIGVSSGDEQHHVLSGKSQSGGMDRAVDIVFTPVGRLPEGLSCSTNGIVAGTPILAGTSIVTFVVHDSVGASTNKPLEIVIAPNPNTRPVISSNAPPTGVFSMGEATNQLFRVWAYDPEDANLVYSWTWNGVPVGGNTSSYTRTTMWGDAGRHVLRCYVSDDLWQSIVYAQWNVIILDDNDGDGMRNGQELDLGRNPNDPNDAGNPSTFVGTVRGGGVGLSDAYIELRGAGGATYYRTLTSSAGTYGLHSVQPGHYYVKVGAELFADKWYDSATHRTNAIAYSVPANTTIGGFDFDLEAGQSLGFVEVISDPSGATIYLDHQPTTNITPAILDLGEVASHCVSLGGGIASHTITVKKAGRPRPPPDTVFAKEAETVQVHFDMTANATGSLSIATEPPGAAVYVDYYTNTADGVTPTIVQGLEPGSHVILLRKAGWLQPRPIVASVSPDLTTTVTVTLATNDLTASRLIADARSTPPGATIYVDYLPTTNITDAVIDWMDPASHAGDGWHTASHTIMLRGNGFRTPAPRYVGEETNTVQAVLVNLILDPVAAVDADRDSLPDQWEDAYDLKNKKPSQNGPNDDPDGDGATNEEEMRAGTNPLDGTSVFGVSDTAVVQDAGLQTVVLTFSTVPGRAYIVQGTDDLTHNWVNYSGVITATDASITVTIALPAGTPGLFFRLVVLAP